MSIPSHEGRMLCCAVFLLERENAVTCCTALPETSVDLRTFVVETMDCQTKDRSRAA